MARTIDARQYVAAIWVALLTATIGCVLMLIFDYPAEDWIGVMVIWHVSSFSIGYVVPGLALVLMKRYLRYAERVADQIGLVIPSPTEEKNPWVLPIAIFVSGSLIALVGGASLAVTGALVPLAGLSDFGRVFDYIAGALLAFGLIVQAVFLVPIFIVVELARRHGHKEEYHTHEQRLSAWVLHALYRLKYRDDHSLVPFRLAWRNKTV